MPRSKGRGEGKYRSLKTGRYVSAHYGKRNPKYAVKEEDDATALEASSARPEGQKEDGSAQHEEVDASQGI